MSKRRIILILLLGLTLVYPLIFYYSAQAYEQELATAFEEYPEAIKPYIDPDPFINSLRGVILVIFGAIIAVSWFILFIWWK